MRSTWQFLALAGLVVILGVTLALQRQTNVELKGMITLLRDESHVVEGLQAERLRLVKAQISPAELENLRADHAAIAQLRAEIELAKARLIENERAEPASVTHK